MARKPTDAPLFSEEELEALERLGLEELRDLFEERMREQNERHDGGNRWIGTGGTSPFGHSGNHLVASGQAVRVAVVEPFKLQ